MTKPKEAVPPTLADALALEQQLQAMKGAISLDSLAADALATVREAFPPEIQSKLNAMHKVMPDGARSKAALGQLINSINTAVRTFAADRAAKPAEPTS